MSVEDLAGKAPEEPVVPEHVPTPEPQPAPDPEPAPTYAYDPMPSAGPAPEPTYEPADAQERVESVRRGLHDAAGRAADWLNEWFPGHGNTVLFGILGLALAMLVFKIGIWRSIVVTVLVICGVAFGQYLDGDPKILRFIRDLLDKKG